MQVCIDYQLIFHKAVISFDITVNMIKSKFTKRYIT